MGDVGPQMKRGLEGTQRGRTVPFSRAPTSAPQGPLAVTGWGARGDDGDEFPQAPAALGPRRRPAPRLQPPARQAALPAPAGYLWPRSPHPQPARPWPRPTAVPKLGPQRPAAACARHGGDLWEVGPRRPGGCPPAAGRSQLGPPSLPCPPGRPPNEEWEGGGLRCGELFRARGARRFIGGRGG